MVEAKNVVVPSNADFDATVNAAHKAIERQVGPDVNMSPEVRAVASSSRKIAAAVRAVRNDCLIRQRPAPPGDSLSLDARVLKQAGYGAAEAVQVNQSPVLPAR